MVLIDKGHNEEAFVLARSILNNYFLINYLLGDDKSRYRLKRYHNQTYIADKYYWEKIKGIIEGKTYHDMSKVIKNLIPLTLEQVEEKINFNKEMIRKNGWDPEDRKLRPLSVQYLAYNSDRFGVEMYTSFYLPASKYEHSDVATLDIYKQPILEEYSKEQVFMLDVNRTDETLEDKIYSMLFSTYAGTIIRLYDHISTKEKHLLGMFDLEKLSSILQNINIHSLINIALD